MQKNPVNVHQATKPIKKQPNHANFLEALKASSGDMVKSVTNTLGNDFVGGTIKQGVDTLFGSSTNQDQQTDNNESPFDFEEYLRSSENKVRAQQKVKYEYESQETVIFNRRQQEVEEKIKSIQAELKVLAKEIVHLDQSIDTAVAQEVLDPGTYHLNFFEKLLVLLKSLRKRVSESRNWAQVHNSRAKTKSYFWKQSSNKTGGTKFMLSSERTVQTQTG